MNQWGRREFIEISLLGLTGFAMTESAYGNGTKQLRIDRIDIFPVRYPTVMRFKFFEGPTSGGGRPAVLIKITADDGTVGWGESVPIPMWSYETLEGAVSTIENYLKPVIIGLNPFDMEGVHAAMNRGNAPKVGRRAICALPGDSHSALASTN